MAILTWAGKKSSGNSSDVIEQWAIKFDDIDTCRKFYNIILIATASPEKTSADDCSDAELMNSSLEFTTKESPDKFKARAIKM